MTDQLIEYDGIALAELIRKNEINPAELVEIVIQRIERVNPKINAVIHKMYDRAREIAKDRSAGKQKTNRDRGLFDSVPFLLKDLVAEYEGVPLHCCPRTNNLISAPI
jgi:amidase